MWLECTEKMKDTGRDLLEMVFCSGNFSYQKKKKRFLKDYMGS